MTPRRQRTLLVVLFAWLLQNAAVNGNTFDFSDACRNRFKKLKQFQSLFNSHFQEMLLYIQSSSIYRLTADIRNPDSENNSNRLNDVSLEKLQRQRFLQFGFDEPTDSPTSLETGGNSDSPSRAPSLQPNESSGDVPTESDINAASSPPSESPIAVAPSSSEMSELPSTSPTNPPPSGMSLQPSPAEIPSSPSHSPSSAKVYTVFPTGDYSDDKNPHSDEDIFPKPTWMPKPSSSSSYSSTENDDQSLSGGGIFGIVLLAGIAFLLVGSFVLRGRRQRNYRGSYRRSPLNATRDLELTRWHPDDDDGLL